MADYLEPEVLKGWLQFADDRRSIDAALTRFAQSYGFDWFSYLSIFGSDVTGLSNYPPEWQSHYLASNLAGVDPVVEAIPLHRTGFLWSDTQPPIRVTREHRSFFEQARGFGIRSGITIPVLDGFGRRAIITLASNAQNPSARLLERRFDAMSLAAYLDAYLRVRDHGILLIAGPCPLSPYQLECLNWVSYGKTNEEIATMRGVTRRAIEFQFDTIRKKLDAVTTAQAMAIAMRHRWLL